MDWTEAAVHFTKYADLSGLKALFGKTDKQAGKFLNSADLWLNMSK